MDYSQLSDFEINKRVADIVMNGTWHVRPSHPDNTTGGWLYGSNGIQTYDLPDYCNSPESAWPIIVGNDISLNSYGSAWEASFEHDAPIGAFGTDETVTSGYEHRNPLRAAMIAFLMKQEQANA